MINRRLFLQLLGAAIAAGPTEVVIDPTVPTVTVARDYVLEAFIDGLWRQIGELVEVTNEYDMIPINQIGSDLTIFGRGTRVKTRINVKLEFIGFDYSIDLLGPTKSRVRVDHDVFTFEIDSLSTLSGAPDTLVRHQAVASNVMYHPET